MTNRIITGITDIDTFWQEVEPFINKALEYNHGEFTTEDIYGWLKNQKMQLWVVHENGIQAAAVTEVVIYPRKKIVRILALAGNGFDEWSDDLQALFEFWGKKLDADGIEIIGRRGWIKKLEKYGYSEAHTVLKKELAYE